MCCCLYIKLTIECTFHWHSIPSLWKNRTTKHIWWHFNDAFLFLSEFFHVYNIRYVGKILYVPFWIIMSNSRTKQQQHIYHYHWCRSTHDFQVFRFHRNGSNFTLNSDTFFSFFSFLFLRKCEQNVQRNKRNACVNVTARKSKQHRLAMKCSIFILFVEQINRANANTQQLVKQPFRQINSNRRFLVLINVW